MVIWRCHFNYFCSLRYWSNYTCFNWSTLSQDNLLSCSHPVHLNWVLKKSKSFLIFGCTEKKYWQSWNFITFLYYEVSLNYGKHYFIKVDFLDFWCFHLAFFLEKRVCVRCMHGSEDLYVHAAKTNGCRQCDQTIEKNSPNFEIKYLQQSQL